MRYRLPIFSLTFLFLFCHGIFSQTIQNDVVASAGDSYLLGKTEVSWTLGESSIESYQSGNISISQGFHQPIFKFFEIPEQENPAFHADVFPNPTCRFIQVELKGLPAIENFRLTLTDMTGKVLINRIINNGNQEKIDLRSYSLGIFLLKIVRVKDSSQRTFKIIRTDY